MTDIYIIAWTGGYEPAAYFTSTDRKEAIDKAVEWAKDADFEQDTIDILRLTDTIDGLVVERIQNLEPDEQNRFDEIQYQKDEERDSEIT